MDTQAVPLEVVELKAGKDGWQFSAYASTWNNVDHVGDVVVRGAFSDTLKARDRRPLLWQHDQHEPIGIEESMREDEHGLLGTWKIIDTTRGADAYKLLKAGAIDRMSIGYMVEDAEYDDLGIRRLKTIDLLETSVVTLPANEEARVVSVKADTSFVAVLAKIQEDIGKGVTEAEALSARRAAEWRKLSDLQRDAIDAFLDELEGGRKRLEVILRDQLPEVEVAQAPSDARGVLLALRYARARHSARMHGVEV